MTNLIRFIAIVVVLVVATMLLLAVAGVLSSSELWSNMMTVAKITAIIFGASALVLLVVKK